MATIVETTSVLDALHIQGRELHDGPRTSGALLLTCSQVVKWGLRLIFVLIVARALGPARFGIYALLFALVEFLAVASGSGYADYLTREAAKDPRSGWGLAFQLVWLRVIIGLLGVALEAGILALFRYPHAVLAGTLLMAITLVPRTLSEAVQGVLRGICHYGAYLIIEATLGAALVLGGVVVLALRGGLRSVIIAELAAAGGACFTTIVCISKYKPAETTGLTARRLVKTGAVFNVYALVGSLYDRFDVVLLSRLAGNFSAGVYSVAYRALGMTQILPYGVLYSLLPGLAANPDGAEERRRLKRASGLLMAAALALVVATFMLATPAVNLLLGPGYGSSVTALKILIWAVPLRYLNCALNLILLASGREKVFVITTSVCLAVNLIGNLLLIPMYSWRGAAAMTVATELVLLVQNWNWVRQPGEIRVFGGHARNGPSHFCRISRRQRELAEPTEG